MAYSAGGGFVTFPVNVTMLGKNLVDLLVAAGELPTPCQNPRDHYTYHQLTVKLDTNSGGTLYLGTAGLTVVAATPKGPVMHALDPGQSVTLRADKGVAALENWWVVSPGLVGSAQIYINYTE